MSNKARPQPRNEELRIAVVMNGGVSLAVWIGGVAHEINRFVGETHPVYRQLLELTSTCARVDVISGTSAGGINGAALALGCVYDTSLSSLRNLWLSKGSFTELLRRAGEKDPPSLLDGDGYFLPALKVALKGLTSEVCRNATEAPMELTMTATMLRGESHTHPDDLGEPIEDSHHRAKFHFSRRARPDPFVSPKTIADALACAARASASFPVAFEPRLYSQQEFRNASTGAPAKHDRYLIDGGVLDNKPIRGALQAIFRLPNSGNVRRVLTYIVPDPAVSAKNDPDDTDNPPSIAEVATASLLSIPSAQSIADQLREIDEQNTKVRQQRHSFAWLASKLDTQALEDMSASLLPAYRERRIDGLLDYVLEEVYAGLSQRQDTESEIALGQRTKEWLKAQWRVADGAAPVWRGLIPDDTDAYTYNLEAAQPDSWAWGVYAVRFVESVVRELLRRTQRLVHRNAADNSKATSGPPLPVVTNADSATNGAGPDIDWDTGDIHDRNRRNHHGPGAASGEGPLAALWARVYDIYNTSLLSRSADSQNIREASPALLELLDKSQDEQYATSDSGRASLKREFDQWLRECIAPSTKIIQRNSALAADLAKVLLDLESIMDSVCNLDPGLLRPDEEKERKELRRLYDLIFKDSPSANMLMRRLLQLEIVYYAMAGRPTTIDAAVELVQISGHCASPWGGPDTPAKKLTGMQLAHFGAFYRKSWRANDWMMGRLDGIDRIVRIALNPDRLHRLYGGKTIATTQGTLPAAQYVYDFLRKLAVDTASPGHRDLLQGQWTEEPLRRELAFLDRANARVPETLPLCAKALTRRLHLEVICKEIPEIARNTVDDVASGAVPGEFGSSLVGRVQWEQGHVGQRLLQPLQRAGAWVRNRAKGANAEVPVRPSAMLSATSAVETFQNCPVGSELMAQEAGTDLLSRTATQTAAVTHSALTGKRSGMTKVANALKVLNLPIRFLHLLANRLASESRTSATIATTLLVSGFLFVLGSVLLDKAPDWLAIVGWSMLFGWFGTAAVRQMNATLVVALIGLSALLVYATGDALSVLYVSVAAAVTIGLAVWAPGWVFAVAASLAALWWTTGHAGFTDIAAAACTGPLKFTGCSTAGHAENGTLFVKAMGPMLAVLFLSGIAYFGSRRR